MLKINITAPSVTHHSHNTNSVLLYEKLLKKNSKRIVNDRDKKNDCWQLVSQFDRNVVKVLKICPFTVPLKPKDLYWEIEQVIRPYFQMVFFFLKDY